jgi:hypothetical protein
MKKEIDEIVKKRTDEMVKKRIDEHLPKYNLNELFETEPNLNEHNEEPNKECKAPTETIEGKRNVLNRDRAQLIQDQAKDVTLTTYYTLILRVAVPRWSTVNIFYLLYLNTSRCCSKMVYSEHFLLIIPYYFALLFRDGLQ